MSAANKAKGTLFESQVADYLQSQNVRAKRLPRTGVKDIGDVAFPIQGGLFTQTGPGVYEMPGPAVIVVEAKNRKAMDLPTWLAESEDEAVNYADKYPAEGTVVPVVVHKRRGKGVHQSYVTMSLDTFVELLREVGAV